MRNEIEPPQRIIRTTLEEGIPDEVGIYILAYMGRILYVGKSEDSVDARIKGHRTNGLHEQLGGWLVQCSDWRNIRIDVLIPPDLSEIRRWLQETEAACISRFNPLFNIRL